MIESNSLYLLTMCLFISLSRGDDIGNDESDTTYIYLIPLMRMPTTELISSALRLFDNLAYSEYILPERSSDSKCIKHMMRKTLIF